MQTRVHAGDDREARPGRLVAGRGQGRRRPVQGPQGLGGDHNRLLLGGGISVTASPPRVRRPSVNASTAKPDTPWSSLVSSSGSTNFVLGEAPRAFSASRY